MADYGVSPELMTLTEVPYGIEEGGAAFRDLMQAKDRPTVVICGNDVLAAGALCQAIQMGLRVPQDVSITGFDDIELATVLTPEITTVHVPHREMGRQAAKHLIAMVAGNGPDTSIELDTRLCLRGSLGPCPKP